jgi:hypothetical protein
MTVRTSLVLLALIGASAVLVSSSLGARATTPTLTGTDGPAYTITLKQNGKAVKTLKAGTYRIVIHDKATIHGYSLDGPNGFAKDISRIPFVGTKTITLKLKAGRYKYYCPNHESIMFGHFTVK